MLRLRNFNVLSKLCSRVEWFVRVVSTWRCRRWECTLPSSVGVSALLLKHSRPRTLRFYSSGTLARSRKSAEVESIRCNSAIRKSLREWLHPHFASQQEHRVRDRDLFSHPPIPFSYPKFFVSKIIFVFNFSALKGFEVFLRTKRINLLWNTMVWTV